MLSLQELDAQRLASKAPPVKTNLDLFNNAELIELGMSDPKKIRVINLP